MPTTPDPSPSAYSIRTRGLSLWYGDFQALREVTINVKPGLITALIGPSGCGKTTLLRCFNRINERYGNVTTKGEIRILGKNIYDPDVSLGELRRSVGMVFQRPNPLPISVRENVLFGLRVHVARGVFSRSEQEAMVETALRETRPARDENEPYAFCRGRYSIHPGNEANIVDYQATSRRQGEVSRMPSMPSCAVSSTS